MTCIIAGKCSNGVAIIGDTNVTYDDRPPAYKEKIVSEYHPVTIAYAGAEMLYKPFKEFAFKELQINETPLSQQNTRPIVQTSGVFSMYTSSDPNSNVINYSSYQSKLADEVKNINQEKQFRIGDFEVFTAIQLSSEEVKLTHINPVGDSDDIDRYKSIGGSGPYSYVFLEPLYDKNMNMKDFVKLGYYIIRHLAEFEMDQDVGGQPQFWCIPNSGDLFSDKNRPDWIEEFESHSKKMLENFRKYIIDEML
jgi:20S proteasome alpha/beta subunit